MLARPGAETARPTGDPALVRRVRRGTRRRTRLVVGGLAVALLLALAARVLLGDYTVTIPDFLRILGGQEIPGASFIVMESKLPRALLGAMVGAAFGLGGAIFQATLRNPLASPDILGISVGASAAALVAIIELDLAGLAVSGFAVVGAIGVALVIRLVAGDIGGNRLVLIGVGLAAALLSVIHYLFTRADVYDAHVALRWLTGSVSSADWPTIRLLAAALVVVVPVVAWLARSLPVTELGPDTATALGVDRWRSEALLLGAVVLVALAVAASGPVAFVAFLAGPIARVLNAGRTCLTGAALVGAVLVVGGDYVADYLIADVNFPVGVVTGACGAPFLLWLIASGRTGRRGA
ncbi:FecCD family ABC transporter permease [Nocardioides houyundeii]|uniref:FecCD family ABC transporter permease n=1 Tax=Nocardioides houyundeii TaxID=2045452 RepID=UPI000C75BF07|nr:iron chelate uptake ABC transporter family permease subunit [Nocardioides houyundeii]